MNRITEPAEKLFNFTGRHVFVSGGSTGINFGIAEAFAKCGADIALISRNKDRVDAAVNALQVHGGKAYGVAADVRDVAAVEAALEASHKEFGDIDVLVSGAAGNFFATATGMSTNAFKAVVDIDLIGSFNVLRLAHRFLRRPGASVINLSAPQSVNPTSHQAHVCAAKAGVDMLTRVLAVEWGAEGIRVNSIMPGPIEGTEGLERIAPTAEAKSHMLSVIPMGRFGTKQDVANMALTLSSELCAFVTGTVIPVDGGRYLSGGAGYLQTMGNEK